MQILSIYNLQFASCILTKLEILIIEYLHFTIYILRNHYKKYRMVAQNQHLHCTNYIFLNQCKNKNLISNSAFAFTIWICSLYKKERCIDGSSIYVLPFTFWTWLLLMNKMAKFSICFYKFDLNPKWNPKTREVA